MTCLKPLWRRGRIASPPSNSLEKTLNLVIVPQLRVRGGVDGSDLLWRYLCKYVA